MKRNRLLVLIVLWSGVCAARAGTGCPPVTRVGLSDLGHTAFRENGRIGGLAVDIVNEIGRRTGCSFEFHWYPRQRLFVELEAGRIDLTLGALRLPERDVYARYLPYAWLQYDLVVRAPAGQNYTSLADFVERGTGRLNVTRGIAYDGPVETQLAILASHGRLEVVNDFETVFGKMEMGRADGTLATPPIYGRYLQHSRLRGVSVIALPEASPRFTGMYVSKKTMPAAVRLRYAAALRAMVEEQYILGLYGQYFDDATIRRMFRRGQEPLLNALSVPE